MNAAANQLEVHDSEVDSVEHNSLFRRPLWRLLSNTLSATLPLDHGTQPKAIIIGQVPRETPDQCPFGTIPYCSGGILSDKPLACASNKRRGLQLRVQRTCSVLVDYS